MIISIENINFDDDCVSEADSECYIRSYFKENNDPIESMEENDDNANNNNNTKLNKMVNKKNRSAHFLELLKKLISITLAGFY